MAAIKTLVRAGADINARPLVAPRYRQDNIMIAGRTPLHWAVAHLHRPSVQALLEAGADRDITAGNNQQARALLADHDDAIAALFDQLAPPAP